MYPSDTDEAAKKKRLSGRHYRRSREDFDANFMECREAILRAFKKLRPQNIRTRANFWCCGSCAGSAISCLDEERKKKNLKPYDGAVFWHRQSEEGLREDGSIYIYFCVDVKDGEKAEPKSRPLAEKLVAALKAEDLEVDWDGNTATAVLVDGFTEKYWKEQADKREFKENVREAYGIHLGTGL